MPSGPRVLVVENDPDTLEAIATNLRDTESFAIWGRAES
jgi:hypothetical protein